VEGGFHHGWGAIALAGSLRTLVVSDASSCRVPSSESLWVWPVLIKPIRFRQEDSLRNALKVRIGGGAGPSVKEDPAAIWPAALRATPARAPPIIWLRTGGEPDLSTTQVASERCRDPRSGFQEVEEAFFGGGEGALGTAARFCSHGRHIVICDIWDRRYSSGHLHRGENFVESRDVGIVRVSVLAGDRCGVGGPSVKVSSNRSRPGLPFAK